MRILDIDPGSPLYGYIRPGYSVLAVNGKPVADEIDFRFRLADDRVHIRFADTSGKEVDFQFDAVDAADLGLTLDDHRIHFCKNNCIFCFVHQQPQGMRRTLYFKDEDYRLSFTHGNFVTLSNTTEADLARIIEQRLSPLYVSVHATDDTLRRCMLKNEKLAPIIPRLKYLGENGIMLHTQVVLCPGINDGPQLERSVEELAALFPHVESLAVVPVGLTKYRDNLPDLRTYTPDEAVEVIRYLEKVQKRLLREHGTRFVWAADEFYIAAGLPFPSKSSYEHMPQFENGIGMAREFITNFSRRKSKLKSLRGDKKVAFLTGASAYGFFTTEIMPQIEAAALPVSLHKVTNRFWGEKVTVSGLLTGQDLLRHARSIVDQFDTVVLPPNCINPDDLFLDNLTLDQFRSVLGKPVQIGQYDLAATLSEVFS
jgi:putative radical SAM enzyme (TIGR03279 family)